MITDGLISQELDSWRGRGWPKVGCGPESPVRGTLAVVHTIGRDRRGIHNLALARGFDAAFGTR